MGTPVFMLRGVMKVKKQKMKKKGKFASGMVYDGAYGASNLWQSGVKTNSGDRFGKKMPKTKKSGKKI